MDVDGDFMAFHATFSAGKSQRFGALSWQVLLEDPKEKGIDLYDEMKKFYAWILSDLFSPAWVSHCSEMLLVILFCPSECFQSGLF